jgi:hypothetical protein
MASRHIKATSMVIYENEQEQIMDSKYDFRRLSEIHRVKYPPAAAISE